MRAQLARQKTGTDAMGTTAGTPETTAIGHTAVRILVALYTIASATGVIVGTNLSLLLTPFMSDIVAQATMSAIVTTLCFLMLIGFKRRAMALLLALIFLWSSYFAILGPNAAIVGGSHWRDMVLIAALLLIYADAAHEAQNDLSTLAQFLRQPRALSQGIRPIKPTVPAESDLNIRRTSQTLFHSDLEEFSER